MNFVTDECVDQPVSARLRDDGHAVISVAEMAPGIGDVDVLTIARERAAILITADKDFGELVFRDGRASFGVLLLRLAGLAPTAKAEVVSAVVKTHSAKLPEAFTVVSPGMVRIRRQM